MLNNQTSTHSYFSQSRLSRLDNNFQSLVYNH